MFFKSYSDRLGFSLSRLIDFTPVAISTVTAVALLGRPPPCFLALKTPVTSTLSPGLTLSTRSFYRMTLTVRGS